jgi:hypothetical protein
VVARASRASSNDGQMSQTYRFRLTVTVDEEHEAYDDPEWFADAAWGVLTNLYGLDCIYTDVECLQDPSGAEP